MEVLSSTHSRHRDFKERAHFNRHHHKKRNMVIKLPLVISVNSQNLNGFNAVHGKMISIKHKAVVWIFSPTSSCRRKRRPQNPSDATSYRQKTIQSNHLCKDPHFNIFSKNKLELIKFTLAAFFASIWSRAWRWKLREKFSAKTWIKKMS